MRIPMMVATIVLLTAGAGGASAAPTMDMPFLTIASALQDPPQTAQPKGGDVKVDVNLDTGRTVWYTDPIWIVVGAAAVIAVVALIAVASRGGGTTVVR